MNKQNLYDSYLGTLVAGTHFRENIIDGMTEISFLIDLNISNKHLTLLESYLVNRPDTKSLKINYVRLDDDGFEFLEKILKYNTNLLSVIIKDCKPNSKNEINLGNIIKFNKFIIKLDISFNDLSLDGIKYICGALKDNVHLTSLNLAFTSLGVEGCVFLLDALKDNTQIIDLDIIGNKIGDDGAKIMKQLLSINKTIQKINFGSNDIGSQGMKYIAEALINHNTIITDLDVSHNHIKNEGLESIIRILTNNKYIKVLNIKFNDIIDTKIEVEISNQFNNLIYLDISANGYFANNIQHIVNIIKNNKIKELNIGYNSINNLNMKYICDAVKDNTSLVSLSLSNNNIRNHEVIYITDMLKNNKNLRSLDLNHNKITKYDIINIGNIIKETKIVTNLMIDDNNIGRKERRMIEEILDANRRLS